MLLILGYFTLGEQKLSTARQPWKRYREIWAIKTSVLEVFFSFSLLFSGRVAFLLSHLFPQVAWWDLDSSCSPLPENSGHTAFLHKVGLASCWYSGPCKLLCFPHPSWNGAYPSSFLVLPTQLWQGLHSPLRLFPVSSPFPGFPFPAPSCFHDMSPNKEAP